MYKESRTETIQVRLSRLERKQLEGFAFRHNTTLPLALRAMFLERLEQLQQDLD